MQQPAKLKKQLVVIMVQKKLVLLFQEGFVNMIAELQPVFLVIVLMFQLEQLDPILMQNVRQSKVHAVLMEMEQVVL